jgi:hypothetical protein
LAVHEDLSPAVLQKVVYAGANERSFRQAHDSLQILAELEIPVRRIERLTERVGAERVTQRNRQTAAWEASPLVEKYPPPHPQCTDVAMVQYDGGRAQVLDRSPDAAGPGETLWSETKVGSLYWMASDIQQSDPCPEVPPTFLDPPRVMKLAAEIGRHTASHAAEGSPGETPRQEHPPASPRAGAPEPLSRPQVLASLTDSQTFGKMLAAAALREGLFEAHRKAFVGDGSAANWSIHKQYFCTWTAILDFVHALTYLFAAAMAGRGFRDGWSVYEQWLNWTWQGHVERVIAALAARQAEWGRPEPDEPETSPRSIVNKTLTYLQNQKERMRYDEYRQQGLPITSCYIESTIKQINHRVKGTEKVWSPAGAEAVLQLRADFLSDTQPMADFWQRRQNRMTGQQIRQTAT